ncbi:MAG: UvrD-helicase domain-containing protein [Clostridiales bacterium]|nr:UvrD-helicase domain-containing protein [Clostridiales bacterium]
MSDNCKQRALKTYFSNLNEMQQKAVFQTEGSVLIIAGAGSGKTTVIVNRVANMILFGNGYHGSSGEISQSDRTFLDNFSKADRNDSEIVNRLSKICAVNPIKPWNLLVITFTNKAAKELKDRLCSRLGEQGADINASTFHSACVKILRRDIHHLGYKNSFTIYDSDDSLRIIKDIIKNINLSDKQFIPKSVQASISHAKDKLIYPPEFKIKATASNDFYQLKVAEIYQEYQDRLKLSNALDFDDLIALTVKLLNENPDVLQKYRNHYKYIMVDEYQDTNIAQYQLVSLLAGDKGNICVVGDDDQSIYKFRGATVENILNFEKHFKGATVIRLEQNYRSTTNILSAANAVIANNTKRKEKALWSDLGDGDKIQVYRFLDDQRESFFVADTILDGIKAGKKYNDFALLYRTNAQSRGFEMTLAKAGIPYRMVGGVRFYERKEIKDIIAYLSVINNPYDFIRFSRIANQPKRGIGDATLNEVERIAISLDMSPLDVILQADSFPGLSRKTNSLKQLGTVLEELRQQAEDGELDTLIDAVIEKTGYRDYLLMQGEEGIGRLENINELKSNVIASLEDNDSLTLDEFLEQVALVSDLDSYDEDTDRVTFMTMHSAKGLEFDTVFIVGAEENIFPSYRSISEDDGIDEERRLAYVAITRAKRKLIITSASARLIYGTTQKNQLSRFVKEIPDKYKEFFDKTIIAENKAFKRKKPEEPNYLQNGGNITLNFAKKAKDSKKYKPGDIVSHNIFREGTIISATPMGNDTMLEIDFKVAGKKKLMANFARLEKL